MAHPNRYAPEEAAGRNWIAHNAVGRDGRVALALRRSRFRGGDAQTAEEADQVEKLAASLHQSGLQPGDGVALVMPNSLEYLVAFFAVTRARLVAAPLNPAYRAEEFRFSLEDAGVRAVLASADARYLFFGLSVGVGAAILLALHPARRQVLRPVTNPSPVLAALAVAGSVPLVGFALTAARLQRTGGAGRAPLSGGAT